MDKFIQHIFYQEARGAYTSSVPITTTPLEQQIRALPHMTSKYTFTESEIHYEVNSEHNAALWSRVQKSTRLRKYAKDWDAHNGMSNLIAYPNPPHLLSFFEWLALLFPYMDLTLTPVAPSNVELLPWRNVKKVLHTYMIEELGEQMRLVELDSDIILHQDAINRINWEKMTLEGLKNSFGQLIQGVGLLLPYTQEERLVIIEKLDDEFDKLDTLRGIHLTSDQLRAMMERVYISITDSLRGFSDIGWFSRRDYLAKHENLPHASRAWKDHVKNLVLGNDSNRKFGDSSALKGLMVAVGAKYTELARDQQTQIFAEKSNTVIQQHNDNLNKRYKQEVSRHNLQHEVKKLLTQATSNFFRDTINTYSLLAESQCMHL